MGKFVTGPAITTSSSSPAFDCRKTAVCLGGLAAAAIASIAIVNPPLAVALVAEHSIVERSQVALVAAGTLLTMREAWRSVRRGRQIPLEIAIVAPLVMACVTELDLDQWLFGSKFIAKRFFADENYPVIARAAAMLVIVGVPVGIGVWLLTRWQTLRDDVTSAVRAPWGQTLAFGVILYGLAELLERPIDKIPWNPHHLLEESAELIAALTIFIALVTRYGVGVRHLHAGARSRFIVWLARMRRDRTP
jgi:hypothetical protein